MCNKIGASGAKMVVGWDGEGDDGILSRYNRGD